MSSRHAGQVVVVTGSSGGIGRATALAFAARGAKVALLARGEAGLAGAARDVEQAGGVALPIPTDVADPDQVEAAAAKAEETLGPIDVWVNVAFTSVFAQFRDIKPGRVQAGHRGELPRLRLRHDGRAQPDAAPGRRHDRPGRLRAGLPRHPAADAPTAAPSTPSRASTSRCAASCCTTSSNVRVTMVQMPAVNTPQFDWVLSRLPQPAQPVPPIYQPEVAARGVLYAADHPRRREYWVGGTTAGTLAANAIAPGLLDRYLARTGFSSQQDNRPESPSRPVNLWEPADGPGGHDYTAHGSFDDESKPRSAQLWASQHHGLLGGAAAAAAGATVTAVSALRRRGRR